MFTEFNKATEPNGKTVRAVKLLDYSQGCERPFDLPLREHLLWSTARYADVHGEFPDGEERFGRMQGRYGPGAFRPDDKEKEEELPPIDSSTIWRNGAQSGEALIVRADLERVRLACGTCHWCANQRKRRWERAAKGWIENSPLTCFGTLTFGDEYFSAEWNQWIDAKLDEGEERQDQPGFDYLAWFAAYTHLRTDKFNPSDPEHDNFMRKRLMAERQKMFKRLRHALAGDPRFEGVKLKAHLSVYEYGDLRGRLHMHFIAHFDIGEMPLGSAYSRLRKFLKSNWHGQGIGFVDVQQATPDSGGEAARYLTNYLLAYQEMEGKKRVTKAKSRLACSLGYRPKGTDLWFAGRPSLIPGGDLRPADPIPAEAREGFPATSVGDADLEALQLSEASLKLSFSEMPADYRALAEEIAKANLAWRDCDLWPGWSSGLERPEDEWAEVPDDAWNFASWLLLRLAKDNRGVPANDDVPPWVTPDCSSAHPNSINITGEFDHPATGQPFSAAQWLSFTNSERVAIACGYVPPWWKDADPPPLSARRKLVRNSDGSVYDADTGEVIDDL